MSSRRLARECALKFLFGFDLVREDLEVQLELFKSHFDDYQKLGEHGAFFEEIAKGVIDHLDLLDVAIEEHSEHWKITRMTCVDRNVLRIATFELLYQKNLSSKIIINEAIEIAKRFGDTNSASFINGVLDSIAKK